LQPKPLLAAFHFNFFPVVIVLFMMAVQAGAANRNESHQVGVDISIELLPVYPAVQVMALIVAQ
jgi:hypothetical protein